MDDTEQIIFLVGVVFSLGAAIRWYWRLFTPSAFIAPRRERLYVAAAPLVCILILMYVLTRYAASDVKDSFVYIAYYLVLGIVWLSLWLLVLPYFGLNIND